MKNQPRNPCTGNDYETRHQEVLPYTFYSMDEQWQNNACATVGLRFQRSSRLRSDDPDLALRLPDPRSINQMYSRGR